ncbi:cystin-1 isoform X3 [Cygnus atratus]|uniref:cystin-1 isoform X3 n=1 Tax=Cygnus atratus TaxID=8868 RepID=UPI0021B81CA7|nr:cystin-1 isoform X3 [Cygnus atratus]
MGSGSSRRRGPVATGGGGGGDPRGPGAAPGPAEAAAGGEGAAALPAPGSPPREAVLPASPPDPENNNVSNEQGCRLCLQVCSSCWPELHADAFWRWFSTRQMFTWMKSKQLRPQKRWLKCVCPGRSSKQPAGRPAVSYDCAEEELMASIEREYGR